LDCKYSAFFHFRNYYSW